MKETLQVIKHEFIHMVKTKGFVIITLIFPLIALVILGGYQFIQRIDAQDTTTGIACVGYVDEAGGFDDISQTVEIALIPYQSPEEATKALIAGDIREYFVITPEYVSTGRIDRFTLARELEMPGSTRDEVRSFLLNNLLQGDISDEKLERAKSPAWFTSTRLDETGQISPEQGGVVGVFLLPYIFSFLFWLAILMCSFTLLEGLAEEKENRIMEILLSSISTRQLLLGKVIGLGIGGLLQILFWFLSGWFILGMVSTTVGGMFIGLEIPVRLIAFGTVYFILGYLIFGTLFAIIGALTPTFREGQQIAFFIVPAGGIPLVLAPFFANNPDHPVTYFLTFFPITAPVSSVIRIGVGNISFWELGLSITLLLISVAVLLFLGAKVFRTFLLMYGKKASLREIIRSLSQA
jgi:ABC-2 type transport system permease protein